MSGRFRSFVDRVGGAFVRRFREETSEERGQRRAARRSAIARAIADCRRVSAFVLGRKPARDAERHYALHPLDAPHPRMGRDQMLRVRIDDPSRDLPVRMRPVVAPNEREYRFVRAGYGAGARVARAKRFWQGPFSGNAREAKS